MRTTVDEKPWNSWTYNVEDRFKGKSKKEIVETLRSTSHNFSVMMEHWNGDFNIGTMIRNANAFNAKKVFYYGKKNMIAVVQSELTIMSILLISTTLASLYILNLILHLFASIM